MATLTQLLADLNDSLNDVANAQAPEATKTRALNQGIAATWPRLYKTARNTTLEIVDDTWEYTIPAAIANNTKLLMVELELGDGDGRYVPTMEFHIVPGLTDPLIVFDTPYLPAPVGSRIRISVATQLTQLVSGSDSYDGPTGTEELPVLYAQGKIMGRRLDDRLDHRRYSTVSSDAGVVTPDTIMAASQFAFAQFELLLDRFAMPLPIDATG